jgi:hypothetical protein
MRIENAKSEFLAFAEALEGIVCLTQPEQYQS